MDELVEEFEAIDGTLRVVASLRPATWEIEYIRDELEGVYSETDFQSAYRSVMANQVSSSDFGRVGSFGDFTGQLYLFDEIIVFQFPSSRYEGVFVSYDRAEEFPVLDVFETAECLPTLDSA